MSALAYHAEHFKKGSVAALARHNFENRSKKDRHSNQDIDPDKSHLNVQIVAPAETLYKDTKKAIEERCTGRVTAGSNWITEIIVYPPDDILNNRNECIEYFNDVTDWLKNEFGEENVKMVVAHFDETTPHIHADVIPFTKDDRLSTKEVFARKNLFRHHTELAEYLQKCGWDVQRGESTKDKQVRSKSVPEFKKDAEKQKLKLQIEIDELVNELDELISQIEPYQLTKQRIDEIDAVEVKIKGLGAKKRAEIDLSVWDKVVPIVKREWATHIENDKLREQNTRQEWHIEELQDGNQQLSRENAKLKEQVKELQASDRDLKAMQAFVMDLNLADQYRKWYIKHRSERQQSAQKQREEEYK